jgi:steroid delta-isomerase-like uncharacterized protein
MGDAQRIIEQWATHWSAHDIDRLWTLFTDDAVYEDVTMGVVNRGAEQFRAFAEGFLSAFPDVTFELRSSLVSHVGGGAEWVMRGTHRGEMPGMPATGRKVDIRGASILEFRQGRISRCSDYWDMATFLKQLGFMPA